MRACNQGLDRSEALAPSRSSCSDPDTRRGNRTRHTAIAVFIRPNRIPMLARVVKVVSVVIPVRPGVSTTWE